MLVRVIIYFFISLLLISCQKENDAPKEKPKTKPEIKYNFILAGDRTSDGVIYTDIQDTTLSVSSGTGSRDIKHFLQYDIDKDGLNDIEFYAWEKGGNGYYSTAITLNSLDNSEVIQDSVDQFLESPSIINSGDTISKESLFYIADKSVFYSSGFSISSGSSWYQPWENAIDKYVALRLFNSSDTLYAWIRIDVLSYGVITIKDYACRY